MKLLLVTHRFPTLSETFVLDQAMAFVRAGIDLTIACEAGGEPWSRFDPAVREALASRTVQLTDPGSPHLIRVLARLADSDRRSAFLGLLRRAWSLRLASLARKAFRHKCEPLGSFDVVLAHFGELGVLAKNMRDVGLFAGPMATFFHGYDVSRHSVLRRNRRSYADLIAKTELLLPISELWRERLLSWGAEKRKTFVHHMGVKVPAQVPVRHGSLEGGPKKLISVGRLVEKKGHRDAILALARSGIEARLTIVGEGPLEGELRTLAQRVAPDLVDFRGRLPHEQVLSEVADADVFVLPSITAQDGDMEGIPVSLMEAMVRGTIVIATRHSGNAELVDDGVNGFLVDENSPDQIAAVLQGLAAGKVDLGAIRCAAFRKVSEEFNEDELNRRLIQRLTRVARQYENSAGSLRPTVSDDARV